MRWCFVSNADNLGAVPDARLAAWIAAEGVPFAMEAVRGTPADRKGGHLACHRGRTVLRETAQVPKGDESFTDVERWRYYNTNNLWIDLEALRTLQSSEPGGPALPLIVNRKTVDPSDATSTPVIQLETAMGAAIGSIEGARAVQVPRHRFAPVKTTDDLLVVRSDSYELSPEGVMLARFDGPAAVRRARQGALQAAAGLRGALPRGGAVAASLRQPDGHGRRRLRRRRRGRGRGRGHRAAHGGRRRGPARLSRSAQSQPLRRNAR